MKPVCFMAETRQKLHQAAARFKREERGAVVPMSIYFLLVILIIGGMSVDFMRYETARTGLQNTLDSAVLAAADLSQEQAPVRVVNDYFKAAGMHEFLTSVTPQTGLNYKTVSATAKAEVPSLFLKMVGVNSLTAHARGTAEEKVSKVEISLVVDISGSMREASASGNTKIQELRTAASTFVDTVLTEPTKDLISISMVPYTAQVNAGPDLLNQIKVAPYENMGYGERYHSHCLDFDTEDFDNAAFDLSKTYARMQHFQWAGGSYYSNGVTNPGCPFRNFERIIPFSQDAAQLKSAIAQYQPRANTAIHLGMKWGVSLLDPSFAGIIENLNDQDKVDDPFRERPAQYSDAETLKTVVLMTDGQNVHTYRLQDWAYNSQSDRDHWFHHDVMYYISHYVPVEYRSQFYHLKYTASQADQMLNNICTAAKNQGIIIWSIGFEVNNHAANVMEKCASTPAHFFRVNGVELADAFHSIAKSINQLRLTQ